MLTMSYRCATCDFASGMLMDAQEHSNATGHNVSISGTVTPNTPQVDETAIASAAEARARESEIMRLARDRGLLKR